MSIQQADRGSLYSELNSGGFDGSSTSRKTQRSAGSNMGDATLRAVTKRLERIRDLCVHETADQRAARVQREEAEAQRLASMSPLERFTYQTTKEINELQQRQLEYNDKINENEGWTRSRDAVAMRNEMNRMKMNLRNKAGHIPPAKTDEEKQQRDTLRRVLDRVKKSDRAQSPRGSAGGSNLYGDLDNNDQPFLGGGGAGAANSGVTEWNGEDNLPGGGYEPIALDQEFATLMDGFRKTDQEIDKMLDMVAHGVTALNQQAKVMSEELKVQSHLLNEAETKMIKATDDLQGMNKKLKKAVKDINKSNLCLYVMCCALLLALCVTAYFLLTGKGNGGSSKS